jgi:hypothetical protein
MNKRKEIEKALKKKLKILFEKKKKKLGGRSFRKKNAVKNFESI